MLTIILDSLDFSYCYEMLIHPLSQNIQVFSHIGGDVLQKDLEIKDLFIDNIDALKVILSEKNAQDVYIFTKNTKTFKNFLDLNNLDCPHIYETSLNNLESFISTSYLYEKNLQKVFSTSGNTHIVCICDDNLGRIFIKKRIKRSLSSDLNLLLQIKQGDYIVHIDHGIGVFAGIIEKTLGNITKEYIELEYREDSKLFVPITEVSRISKYVGSEHPKLTALGTTQWEKKIQKAGEEVEKIALELLDVYAQRQVHEGFRFLPFHEEEAKFQKSFEFSYTQDQTNAIHDIFIDMESSRCMDRLLCGDVGFGKTEVAFNAVFKALLNGKQAALISPLVVLAYEHFEKAGQRFIGFPFNIAVITRFEKAESVQNTLEKLKTGKIDFVIGTHRLLSEDISFKNLGLLVIDEEHKFGVKDKEKIKRFKGNIDILSLSATPIPRSLNMALNGLKSTSLLTTPPLGRQPIDTIVSHFNDNVILKAGKYEFERGGQLFFVHNRIETIEGMYDALSHIFPGKKIIVAHGQLPGDTLEKRIIDFKNRKYDILLSTTVIENGIDFSNVNTIIINDAQNFGMSQIHQLRGRVGRSPTKGYCYLLVKKDVNEDAGKRLKTIVEYSHLGAGFELAMKDLEIRGGGEILGIRQSGQSVEIGVNLFIEMLEDRVEELKQKSAIWTTVGNDCHRSGNGNDEEMRNENDSNTRNDGNRSLRETDSNERNENDSNARNDGNRSLRKINTKIDLNIGAFVDDSFFSSELDKLNFYREIESITNTQDLDNIIENFTQLQNNIVKIPKETQNLFDLLRLKIYAHRYHIDVIKKVGINYQIDFGTGGNPENNIRKFLDADREVKFKVISGTRLRSETKNFVNDENFVQYMLSLLNGKIGKKVRLKKD